MLLHSVLVMRLIRCMISLLTVLDEVENFRPALVVVDDLGNQLACLRRGQGR